MRAPRRRGPWVLAAVVALLVLAVAVSGPIGKAMTPGSPEHHRWFASRYDTLAEQIRELPHGAPLPRGFEKWGVDGIVHRAADDEPYVIINEDWRGESGTALVLSQWEMPVGQVGGGGWRARTCERFDHQWLRCWGS